MRLQNIIVTDSRWSVEVRRSQTCPSGSTTNGLQTVFLSGETKSIVSSIHRKHQESSRSLECGGPAPLCYMAD